MKNLVKERTRCLLVRPEFQDNTFYNLKDVYTLFGARAASPPLGLLTAAGMLPEHWELKFVDHDVTPLRDEHIEWADIVMISGIGPQVDGILDVVRRAHEMGKLTIVGGSGPTLQPHHYGESDFVVIGEAEQCLPALLEDLSNNVTSGVYSAKGMANLLEPVTPRYDLAILDKYMFIGHSFSRGCPFACEFCAQIDIFGRKARTKNPEQVLAELQLIYDHGFRGMIDFGFDNLIGDIPRATETLRAMAKWQKEHDYPFMFSTEATVNLARHKEVLSLMRDNDFRYLFVGIESADAEVLAQTKKGQNIGIHSLDAVKTFHSYGLIVYTGLILGFDGETDRTASNILAMVQETGAFPALILPLHALPGTALTKRLRSEGRLFEGGDLMMDRDDRSDTATTGLNFVTDRPRIEIARDLIRVLHEVYDPREHYQRVALVAKRIKTAYKHKETFRQVLTLAWGFIRICLTIGLNPRTAPHFWREFLKALFFNRQAIAWVVSQAAMQAHYRSQSLSYIKVMEEHIAEVESMGEEKYNAQMVGAPSSAEEAKSPPTRQTEQVARAS